jgi:hypothetical protein
MVIRYINPNFSLAVLDFCHLSILETIVLPNSVNQCFFLRMCMTIGFRKCSQYFNVILFAREILVFEEANHIDFQFNNFEF